MKHDNQELSLSLELKPCRFMGGSQWEVDGRIVFINKGDKNYSILSCSPQITPDATNIQMFTGDYPVNIPQFQTVSLALHIEFSLDGELPQSLELEFKDQNSESHKETRQLIK